MRPWRFGLLVPTLCLTVGGSACKQDAFMLVDATTRTPEGAPSGTIPAFTPVKVRAIPFMDEGWIRVVEGPFVGEVRRSAVAVQPLQTTTSYVSTTHTELKLRDSTRRLLGCTAITGIAVTADDGDRVVVVEQDRPIGFVMRRETSPTKPEAATFWSTTEGALRSLGAREAETAAEATLTCDAGHVAAREVLAALVGTDDPARASELLARRKTPPQPLPSVASGAALTSGAVAFVAATDQSLRSEPLKDAPVVVALPIGTSVRVLEVAGPFARVQSLAGDLVVDLGDPFADADDNTEPDAVKPGDAKPDGDAPKPDAPKPDEAKLDDAKPDAVANAVRDVVRTGFVPTDALGLTAPDATRLQADALALGATPEAVVVWQRVLALEPRTEAVRKALVDMALKAGRPREAALALHTPAPNTGRGQLTATMDTLRGCVGDVRSATVIDGDSADASDASGDTCVDFDPRPACLDRDCPEFYGDADCSCGDGEHDHEGDESDAGPPKPAAVVEAEAAAARARQEAEAAESAATEAREQADAAEARIELVADVEKKKAQTALLEGLFPRGPFVRLHLGRLETLPPGTTLHLARMTVQQECGPLDEPVEIITAPTFAPRPLPLPTPLPQGELVFIFEADTSYTYAVYRVAPGEPGPDSGQLADRREARLADVFVPDTDPDCSCGPACFR